MKKIFTKFSFFLVFASVFILNSCQNKPAGNTETTTTDSTLSTTEVTDSAKAMPSFGSSEWTVIVKVESSAHVPVVGALTRLKNMVGDTSCRFDSSINTDSLGIAKYSGVGNCPCTKFRAGVQTTGCTKVQDNVHCSDVVTFTCP